MSKIHILVFFIFSFVNAFAQVGVPEVPSTIYFGDLELIIKPDARKQIQTDVNAIHRHPAYFQRKVDQVNLYFPIIERIFREENIPDDFKYLVIQESSLISDAVSTSNAVGFWQFKAETGREVGLRIDNQVDERINIVSSSRGAAKYLKKNNFFFNNWIYALMAYNTGPGGAERYIENKYRGAKRMEINNKTHWYVKKFLAHKIAYENYVGKNSSPTTFLFEYTEGRNQSLEQIARAFHKENSLVEEYNKWLKRGKIPDDKIYTVVIPMQTSERPPLAASTPRNVTPAIPRARETADNTKNRAHDFKDESSAYPDVTQHWITGTTMVNRIKGTVLEKNQDLNYLLEASGLNEKKFRRFNDMTPGDRLLVGQPYYFKRKKGKAPTHHHVLLPGETLWEVSQRYGIRLASLKTKNRLKSESEAKPGMVLWLRFIRPVDEPISYQQVPQAPINQSPVKSTREVSPNPEEPVNNTPAPIASTPIKQSPPLTQADKGKPEPRQEVTIEFVSEEELLGTKAKPIEHKADAVKENPNKNLYPGDTEILQASVPVSSKPQINESNSNTGMHTVQPGETLYSIARNYGIELSEIRDWNGLSSTDNLKIGQQLIIQKTAAKSLSQISNKPTEKEKELMHEVKGDDTMYSIARKYNVTIKQIMEWNHKEDFIIKQGEKLRILQF